MWVAVEKDGAELIFPSAPVRSKDEWMLDVENDHTEDLSCIYAPKGTIKRLLGYPLTWDDEAQEIIEYK